jgi:hypothetical protein
VAEWLGRALQKLPQRFESARDLFIKDHRNVVLTHSYSVLQILVDFQLFVTRPSHLRFLTLQKQNQLKSTKKSTKKVYGVSITL